MYIGLEDLSASDLQNLLRAHLEDMRANSPPGTARALDLGALAQSDISLWTAREGGRLLGCAALQPLDHSCAEIKSMRTHPDALRAGVATRLLQHLIQEAKSRGYTRLYLETGSTTPFNAALALYEKHGFRRCAAFGAYEDNGFNVFMVIDLQDSDPS